MNICNTLNGRIKIGDKVYRVAGGGGGVNFAIIQVGYPKNDKKPTITGTNFRATAPDTSGLWLCGVPVAGTYTISYGEAPTQEVVITTKGQVESIYISEQTENYNILYLLGDENVDYTGGITLIPNTYIQGEYKINSRKDLSAYKYIGISGKYTCTNNSRTSLNPELKIKYEEETIIEKNYGGSLVFTPRPITIIEEINTTKTGQNEILFGWYNNHSSSYLDRLRSSIQKNTDNIFVSLRYNLGGSTGDSANLNNFSLCLLKQDNISILSSYGSTIEEILANSTNLFMDRQALTKMCQVCTGDFMFSAVTNATFKTAYNASENKDILLANEHWAKFIPLMQYI